jgi:hypothetical protein
MPWAFLPRHTAGQFEPSERNGQHILAPSKLDRPAPGFRPKNGEILLHLSSPSSSSSSSSFSQLNDVARIAAAQSPNKGEPNTEDCQADSSRPVMINLMMQLYTSDHVLAPPVLTEWICMTPWIYELWQFSSEVRTSRHLEQGRVARLIKQQSGRVKMAYRNCSSDMLAPLRIHCLL